MGSEISHVALLDVVVRVLVRAVGLAALAEVAEEAADGHAGLVELVQEPARLALHAEAAKPVPAHRLAVAPATSAAPVHTQPVAASASARARVGGGRHGAPAPGRRDGVEAALEVEAQSAVAVVHGEMLGFGIFFPLRLCKRERHTRAFYLCAINKVPRCHSKVQTYLGAIAHLRFYPCVP